MNNDFPMIITMLRKERKLSQKQVSTDLGISQALLSHYEKGIRECGLDFLLKTAEYYDVSCDFLLGRTVHRNGGTVKPADIPDADDNVDEKSGNMLGMINKKVITNTNTVIFDILSQIDNKKLTNSVSNYMMNSQYQIFRTIYSAEKSNPQNIFTLSQNRYRSLCQASQTLDLAVIDTIVENEKEKATITLSPDLISRAYEKGASSVFNVLKSCEKSVKSKFR